MTNDNEQPPDTSAAGDGQNGEPDAGHAHPRLPSGERHGDVHVEASMGHAGAQGGSSGTAGQGSAFRWTPADAHAPNDTPDDPSDGIWRDPPGPGRGSACEEATAGGRLGRYFTTRWEATHAVGPGWRRLVGVVCDAVSGLPIPRTLDALLRPAVLLYLEYNAAKLDIVLLPTCPVAAEDVRHLRVMLGEVYRESGTVCEACGAPALDAEPRRSTRTHCGRHALVWASGLTSEEELWERSPWQ